MGRSFPAPDNKVGCHLAMLGDSMRSCGAKVFCAVMEASKNGERERVKMGSGTGVKRGITPLTFTKEGFENRSHHMRVKIAWVTSHHIEICA